MKKIEKIGISNFQIWDDIEIGFKNFNVIKGSSNSGKSAIVRAINMALSNDWHKSWLRKNESKTTVKLTFNDDTYIERIRGSVNSVSIRKTNGNEESWSGFGSSYPQEVVDFLNISNENCSYQFDSHFFLSLSPTKRALTLGTFSDLQRIDNVLDDVYKGVRNNEATIKSVNLNLTNNTLELDNIQQVLKGRKAVEILVDVRDYNCNLQQILDIQNQLEDLDSDLNNFGELDDLTTLNSKMDALHLVSDIFSVNEEISLVEKEIREFEDKIEYEEICPTCGQLIGEDHDKI
jgi:predicted ATP-dependent endonuclease of OLD family